MAKYIFNKEFTATTNHEHPWATPKIYNKKDTVKANRYHLKNEILITNDGYDITLADTTNIENGIPKSKWGNFISSLFKRNKK